MRGTVTAVIELLQQLQDDMETGLVPTVLGVDISSAFDCVDRQKLLRTLRHLGMGPKSLSLMGSYFETRTQ